MILILGVKFIRHRTLERMVCVEHDGFREVESIYDVDPDDV